MVKYLAIADADRVQEYVFTPPALQYVRGASELQKDAIEEIKYHAGAGIVYANGGVALAEFGDEERARAFCARATEIFREKTDTAGVTTAIAAYEGDEFQSGWKRVRDAVENRKRQRNWVRPLGPHWLQVACERCGERAAETDMDEHGTRRIVCRTCKLKYARGGQQRAR